MNVKTIISALALTAAVSATAQLPSMTPQIDLGFIREAISPAVKVVRTTYFMADAELTQRYSSQTDTVYGYDYSLAYQTPDGFIISEGTVNPWLTDPRFEEFRNSTEYTPLLNNRAYATLSDKPVYENLAPKPLTDMEAIGKDSGLVWFRSENIPAGTIKAGAVKGAKGFMAWFVIPRDTDLQTNTDLNIKFSRLTPEFDDKGFAKAGTLPITGGEIAGGIYVQPVAGDNGTITLHIAGVLSRTSPRTGAWRLVRIDAPGSDATDVAKTDDGKDTGERAGAKTEPELKPID
ncbi:MAG: hypothetical protein Q4C34_02445 [Bacteroidales bacterium]|nr:hypothetical protein [Bacteroidales bacterium]